MTEPLRALFVAPGEGNRLVFNGTERRMKATAKDTQGHLTAFESSYPVGVPHPLHIHHDAIESFYVLEGTCRFYVGGEVITANQGSFVSIPRGVTHGFMPVGGGARALVMFTPAAMEGFGRRSAPRLRQGVSTRRSSNCCDAPITCSRSDHFPRNSWSDS
jgi:quercetin dioxygenase-like cupin family protein